MSTCNMLHLQTLGSQLVMPKNLPDRWVRAQHFPSNLYPYLDHNHEQRPMPTHSMTCAHVLRNCVMCVIHLHQVLGCIGQIKGRSLSLASARSASWLAYSLHLRSLTPIWSWMQGCTKPLPHPWTITSHPCPTQNPWVWVGMGIGTRCRALLVVSLMG